MTNFVHRSNCPGCTFTGASTVFSAPLDSGVLFEFLRRYYSRAGEIGARLAGAVFRLDECDHCSLVFQRWVPNDELLSELYDRWLGSSESHVHDALVAAALDAPRRTRDAHELFAVSAFLGASLERLRVLDYGMGWGLWARIAGALGCQVHGYDLSVSRQRAATQHGIKVVQLDAMPGLELDFINTEQVFEHLPSPAGLIDVLARSLRVGGVLKISVPRAVGLRARLAVGRWGTPASSPLSLDAVHPLEHINTWNPRALRYLAARAGLEELSVPWRVAFSFLREPDSLYGLEKGSIKSVMRPVYNRYAPGNLYRWFRKTG